jgi:hypothetical protein
MKTFFEYLEGMVWRVDPNRVSDFGSNKRSYAILKGDGGSGAYDPSVDEEPVWAKGKEYDVRRGMFATDYKRVLAYLIPRDVSWIRYGIDSVEGKPTLYLDSKDRRQINSYRPYLSSFDMEGFEKLGTGEAAGEYFSENPPKPVNTKRVTTVLNTLRRFYVVKFVRDLVGFGNRMHKEGKHFESEGLGEFVSEDSIKKELSSEEMISYLRKNHDTNLHQDYIDHINTFYKFVLKRVPLADIKTDLEGLDKSKVEEYKKMDFSTSPPIVLGDGYILDGYHRANVAKSLRLPTIKAYVGIKE